MKVWQLIGKVPFHRLDHVIQLGKHHRLLDTSIGWIRGRPLFLPFGFYEDGWGDPTVCTKFRAWINFYEQHSKAGIEFPRLIQPQKTPVKDTQMKNREMEDAFLWEGNFPTSAIEMTKVLPKVSNTAHFLFVEPKEWKDSNRKYSDFPVAVLLAGTGEHGYSRRLQSIALPLASRGIGSLILESPFYGKRKPKNQTGSKLRKVSDLPALGRTTIEETCSLLQWMKNEKGYGPFTVGGVSMGGLHGAMVATLVPYPVGVVSWLGPPSAAPVFSQGLMANFCSWRKLQKEADKIDLPNLLHGHPLMDVRDCMHKFLSLTNLENFPRPVRPDYATFFRGMYDRYVPAPCSESYWSHLENDKWKGATFRELPVGHVSGILFRNREICDAFEEIVFKLRENPDTNYEHDDNNENNDSTSQVLGF